MLARHCEAAKPPKQSRVHGREAPLWIASPSLALALAMTENNGRAGSQ